MHQSLRLRPDVGQPPSAVSEFPSRLEDDSRGRLSYIGKCITGRVLALCATQWLNTLMPLR